MNLGKAISGFYRSLRQKFKLFLFEHKDHISNTLRISILVFSLLNIANLVYYHGYSHEPETQQLLINFARFFLGFYVFYYLTDFIFSLDKPNFIRQRWFAGVLTLLIIYDGISLYVFGYPLLKKVFTAFDLPNVTPFYNLFIQLYLLLLIIVEAAKATSVFGRIRVKPAVSFIISFIVLILIGTFLLMMPEMTKGDQPMPFLTALFTAASASCVTGLIVVDTATYFTLKGQLVILVLFQLGAIGIISFASFFASFIRKGVGLAHQNVLRELFDSESLHGAYSLVKRIVFLTFSIEIVGAVIVYFLWLPHVPFNSIEQKIFFSVFHSVSAFCNAGFSLFSNGLYEPIVRENYMVHLVIAMLIFAGSIGFPAIRDVFSIKNMRERLRKPWMQWKISTKIAVYASIALVVVGAVFFYILEHNNTLAGQTIVEKGITALFQSVTTRTAGFNTVDFSLLGAPMLVLMIFFMFIGASSGSTGGGIKTSTFVLIFLNLFATVTGKKQITLGRRSISIELMYKAFSIFIFSASFVFLSTFILSILEPQIPMLQLLFEEVSAFATVGLSTGITASLSSASKIVLIFSMFVGRVGILTLAFALSTRTGTVKYKYPHSHLMVG